MLATKHFEEEIMTVGLEAGVLFFHEHDNVVLWYVLRPGAWGCLGRLRR